MKLVIASRIEGLHEGFAPGAVHEMTNGLHWRQTCGAERPALSDGPRARVFHDGSAYFLTVEGLPGRVRVELAACRRKSWPVGSGADESADLHVVGQGVPAGAFVE